MRKLEWPSFLLVATLPLVCAITSAANQDKLPPVVQQVSGTEIKNLIAELSDEDPKIREQATKRLEQIGAAALEGLQLASETANTDSKKQLTQMVQKIRADNKLPAWVDGMEFRLVLAKEWLVPRQGGTTAIEIKLRITNTTNTVYRVYLVSTLKINLINADGKAITRRGGVERDMAINPMSSPLRKNDSATISLAGRVVQHGNGAAFGCMDAFTRFWDFPDFPLGTYRFVVLYANKRQRPPDGGDPCWVGEAETATEIVVK